jgi:hypothetical protein
MVLERFPYDVLRHILSFLQQHNSGTLSALARTSHSIHELAVDLLWENQQTLWPLVLLLPSFVIERASLVNRRLSSWATVSISSCSGVEIFTKYLITLVSYSCSALLDVG